MCVIIVILHIGLLPILLCINPPILTLVVYRTIYFIGHSKTTMLNYFLWSKVD